MQVKETSRKDYRGEFKVRGKGVIRNVSSCEKLGISTGRGKKSAGERGAKGRRSEGYIGGFGWQKTPEGRETRSRPYRETVFSPKKKNPMDRKGGEGLVGGGKDSN